MFFDYRIYKEEGLIKSSIDSKINLSPDEITNVFQAYLLPKLLNEQLVAASATSNTSKIGFQSTLNKTASNQEETRNTNGKTPKFLCASREKIKKKILRFMRKGNLVVLEGGDSSKFLYLSHFGAS